MKGSSTRSLPDLDGPPPILGCPGTVESSQNLTSPFRARIHTLNVRCLRDDSFGSNRMEDIINTPFFFASFPKLESLCWSSGCFSEIDWAVPISTLPRKLFGSSLPRLQKLSMANCWELTMTDTLTLRVVPIESTRDFRPPTHPPAPSSTTPRLLVLDQLPHRSQRKKHPRSSINEETQGVHSTESWRWGCVPLHSVSINR